MCSTCSVSSLALALLLVASPSRPESAGDSPAAPGGAATSSAALRVGADPNNLPFSNRGGQGFENALAELIARDLGRPLTYVWWPERRGFIRHTLRQGHCDLVLGVPVGFDQVLPTRPYYRSSYVVVTRHDRRLAITSLDDPRLKTLRIGVHVIGDDYASLPPVQALARRGIVRNLVGYSIYGDADRPNPPAALIDAVARGDVDVAIAWGPLAGYFAKHEPVALDVIPLAGDPGDAGPPLAFDMAVGVRKDDAALRDTIDAILARRAPDIRDLLARYGVPLVAGSR